MVSFEKVKLTNNELDQHGHVSTVPWATWSPWGGTEKSHTTSSKLLPPPLCSPLPSNGYHSMRTCVYSTGNLGCSGQEAIYRDAVYHFCARGLGTFSVMDFLRLQQLLSHLHSLNKGNVHFVGYYCTLFGVKHLKSVSSISDITSGNGAETCCGVFPKSVLCKVWDAMNVKWGGFMSK